jgi:peptidoglycan/xylan/chitin deacetylase (PgdA/CDA1 family)
MQSSLTSLDIRKPARNAALRALKKTGAFHMARRAHRFRLRILAYHGVWNADDGFPGDAMFIRPDTFRRRMELLAHWGYRVVSLEEGLRLSLSGLAEDAVVITVDDGWSTMDSYLWPTLKSLSYPATLYVDTAHLLAREPLVHVMAKYLGRLLACGQIRMRADSPQPASKASSAIASLLEQARQRHRPVAERLELLRAWAAILNVDLQHYLERRVFEYVNGETLRAMSDSGLDVQLHTHGHSLGDFGFQTVQREIETNRRILSELCDVPPQTLSHFCYPSGRSSAKAVPVFKALGIRSATLTAPGLACARSNPYFLPRILDGDHMTDLHFEAELCGLVPWLRESRPAGSARLPLGPLRDLV